MGNLPKDEDGERVVYNIRSFRLDDPILRWETAKNV